MTISKKDRQALEELEEFKVFYNGTHPQVTEQERQQAVTEVTAQLGKKYYKDRLNVKRYK